jgi:hypothetical protein
MLRVSLRAELVEFPVTLKGRNISARRNTPGSCRERAYSGAEYIISPTGLFVGIISLVTVAADVLPLVTRHDPQGENDSAAGDNHAPPVTQHDPQGENDAATGDNHAPPVTRHHPQGENDSATGDNHAPPVMRHDPQGENDSATGEIRAGRLLPAVTFTGRPAEARTTIINSKNADQRPLRPLSTAKIFSS